MTLEKLLVIGAGGQGKVVIDAVRKGKLPFDLAAADDDEGKRGQALLGLAIAVPVQVALASSGAFHVAIGNNRIRERVTLELASRGLPNPAIAHPMAAIADSARIGAGSFIAAQAVVGPDAAVAHGCIVNHGAVIDHDCQLGAFSHVAPGATLAGAVRLGARVLVGAGANILPGVSIGDDCVIGAGAVVVNDIEAGGVYVGVPARRVK